MIEGPWIQTITGKAVDLMSPQPWQVDLINDIPHALARICRFNGHVDAPIYSVAQHCVIGAETLMDEANNPELAAAFLLHDAHEAYLGDIATPVRRAVCDAARLLQVEMALDRAIFAAAGLSVSRGYCGRDLIWDAVKEMDRRMLAAERKRLLRPAPQPWPGDTAPAPQPVPRLAECTIYTITDAAALWRAAARKYLPIYNRG